jgi:hypothetical protein
VVGVGENLNTRALSCFQAVQERYSDQSTRSKKVFAMSVKKGLQNLYSFAIIITVTKEVIYERKKDEIIE